MARRKPKHKEPLPYMTGRFCGRFPEQRDEVDPAELRRRHAMSERLLLGRFPAVYLQGTSSHGELFDASFDKWIDACLDRRGKRKRR